MPGGYLIDDEEIASEAEKILQIAPVVQTSQSLAQRLSESMNVQITPEDVNDALSAYPDRFSNILGMNDMPMWARTARKCWAEFRVGIELIKLEDMAHYHYILAEIQEAACRQNFGGNPIIRFIRGGRKGKKTVQCAAADLGYEFLQ